MDAGALLETDGPVLAAKAARPLFETDGPVLAAKTAPLALFPEDILASLRAGINLTGFIPMCRTIYPEKSFMLLQEVAVQLPFASVTP